MIATGKEADERRERDGLPTRIFSTIWSNLPLLLLMDFALLVAAVPAVALFFVGGAFFAPVVAAATVGGVWAGVVASTDRMIRDEAVSAREFFGNVRGYALRGVFVSLVPAVVATATLGTISILEATRQGWLLVPLAVDGSVSILVFIAMLSAFSLATTGRLKGWELWRTSLGVAAARPLATLASGSVVILAGFLVGVLPGMAPVLPALIAVYLSAVTWSTIGFERERGGSS